MRCISFVRAFRVGLLILLTGCAGFVAHADPLVIETWSNGTTEGWGSHEVNLFSDNPGSGGNPGGWLRGVRGANPHYQMNGSGGIFNGNYGTLFGSNLTLSFDVHVEDGDINVIRLVFRNSNSTTDWRYDFDFSGDPLVVADGWTPVAAPINTTWSDAQATANGWTLVAGGGSWASAVADISSNSYLATITGSLPPIGSTRVTGIDNFAISLAATAHPGDFDGDGDVDGADFVAWQTNFPKATGATLSQGDADGDGDVDGADFVVWQTNFPFTPGPSVSSIPEPSSLFLASSALACPLALRHYKQRRRA